MDFPYTKQFIQWIYGVIFVKADSNPIPYVKTTHAGKHEYLQCYQLKYRICSLLPDWQTKTSDASD